ncbi:hypothetical protein M409DRAFT_60477 [Zasmidium cellare ATCC 36951]|uniref:Cytochrome P450 n=1 Tax=Zasmidium cellare ATCC 36951 TaxID=1080233 RepID=A0A6A6C3B9_ZASCE|nr:uncharacterized protein M409DRAFT_60477 [Zasmidium cellare ATCC 36951]KAF2159886.1 hypothetical protein M409DRAFT_60477 [Zasmidium cellare ATCC 36951]
MLFDSPFAVAGVLFLLLTTGYLYLHLNSPLRSVPGPFLARFSRLWYFLSTYGGRFQHIEAALHAKHGKIVRLAPNLYSISDPSAIATIYKRRQGDGQFRKSDSYASWEVPGQPNVFSGRDVTVHANTRKKLTSAYTMSAMATYEAFVDNSVAVLCRRLEEASIKGTNIDLAWWLQCFAFDVIGEITYSQRFGFLDKGEDQHALIESVHGNNRYSLFMGVFPEWHQVCFGIIALMGKLGLGQGNQKDYLIEFTKESKERRQEALEKSPEEGQEEAIDGSSSIPKDFMTKFIEHHQQDPDRFTLDDIFNGIGGNINAGSDTTGISLSAIIYYLSANPTALQRLREEMEQHQVSDPVTFKESQKMEYLQAVLKEGLRLHPAVSVPLSRTVPSGGAVLAGQYFPAGTDVGVNPYILHRDREVYGDDAEDFRPERWLENDAETLARMERSWCPFGLGSRTCLGKNISLLEISKAVPQLVRRFDFDLSDELRTEGLESTNEFFLQITNFWVRVRSKQREEA